MANDHFQFISKSGKAGGWQDGQKCLLLQEMPANTHDQSDTENTSTLHD
jgi:hypothetical protein